MWLNTRVDSCKRPNYCSTTLTQAFFPQSTGKRDTSICQFLWRGGGSREEIGAHSGSLLWLGGPHWVRTLNSGKCLETIRTGHGFLQPGKASCSHLWLVYHIARNSVIRDPTFKNLLLNCQHSKKWLSHFYLTSYWSLSHSWKIYWAPALSQALYWALGTQSEIQWPRPVEK